jgi:penicillin-binding protein 2
MIPASRWRLVVLHVLVATLLIGLGGRLWYLQVINGTAYAKIASESRTRTIVVPAERGQVLDDVGQPLVRNTSSLEVSVDTMTLRRQSDGGAAVMQRLSGVLGIPVQRLWQEVRLCSPTVSQPCWSGSPYQPIPVAENVSDRAALQIMEEQQQFSGISAQVQPVVQYPQPDGANAAQVLGYLGPITQQELAQRKLQVTGFSGVDLVGRAGVEEQYDSRLRGTTGTRVVSVDAGGNVTGTVGEQPSQAGDNLVTSVNATIQADAEKALANAVNKAQGEGNHSAGSGAAVVLNAKNGQVVALASYPNYDPNVWANGISQHEFNQLFGTSDGEPILDRATQGQWSPGSTWKVTSTAAAMGDGWGPDSITSCPGSVSVSGRTFNNWTSSSMGDMTLHQALVMSCDTVFYQIANDMWQADDPNGQPVAHPRDPMQNMELAWGFGHNTGIDLPEENPGLIPNRQWKLDYWKSTRAYDCKYGNPNGSYVQQIESQDCQSGYVWLPGDAVNASIGQGDVLVTPLQLARGYAALANGGTLFSPRVGEALIAPDGKVVQKITAPVTGHLPVPASTLSYIRNALSGVTTQGTAAGAFAGFPLNQLPVAGKTGTAEVAGGQATSVYASFAPANNPQYVVVVMVPNSGEGADVSAPAARQIWDGIYGLEGHKAAFPRGKPPSSVPSVQPDGMFAPPAGYRGGSG